jgi:hypothetical protein
MMRLAYLRRRTRYDLGLVLAVEPPRETRYRDGPPAARRLFISST